MVDQSYSSLKRAGNSCNSCFLYDRVNESQERAATRASVKMDLREVVSSGDGWKQTAQQAFGICNECYHKVPGVFQFLETQGVRF